MLRKPDFCNILVTVNCDSIDLGGNTYPDYGYVDDLNYVPNKDLCHGLWGFFEGYVVDRMFFYEENTKYLVVRTRTDSLKIVDRWQNLVKFPSGMVLFAGTKEGAEEYLEHSISPNRDNAELINNYIRKFQPHKVKEQCGSSETATADYIPTSTSQIS